MPSFLRRLFPCRHCREFRDQTIHLPADLQQLLARVRPAVIAGELVVDDGDLEWEDLIYCKLHCQTCGRAYELRCETYHGRGGAWKRVRR